MGVFTFSKAIGGAASKAADALGATPVGKAAKRGAKAVGALTGPTETATSSSSALPTKPAATATPATPTALAKTAGQSFAQAAPDLVAPAPAQAPAEQKSEGMGLPMLPAFDFGQASYVPQDSGPLAQGQLTLPALMQLFQALPQASQAAPAQGLGADPAVLNILSRLLRGGGLF